MQLRQLQQKFNNIASLDLDILLAHTLQKPREFLCSHPEYPISNIQYLRLRWYIHRYQQGYSVAAITRHKEFYGLDFFVNKHTLIPRPETELVVENAAAVIARSEATKQSPDTQNRTILIDVGTGSGCIPISILKILAHKNIKTFATDISRSALWVAKKNARKHGVKINFLHGNLLEPITRFPLPTGEGRGVRAWLNTLIQYTKHPHPVSLSRGERGPTVIITANLPYLTAEQFAAEPSIQREPRAALVADEQGLALYKKLLQQITSLISNIKYPISIFLEIDPSQSSKITSLIKKCLPTATIEIKTDLAGRDRLVKIHI